MTPISTLPQHFIHTHVTIELSTTMYEQLARGSLSYSSFLSLTLVVFHERINGYMVGLGGKVWNRGEWADIGEQVV